MQAPWLLMIETDYVWMKPVAAPQAESSALSIAFPFGYITPQAPAIEVSSVTHGYSLFILPLSCLPLVLMNDLQNSFPEWPASLTRHSTVCVTLAH